MTPAKCEATAEGKEFQLEDKRDGNKYWVGKMKDGRCWMLQNLALDITEAGLKASDTDITEDWNSSSTYPPKATDQISVAANTNDTVVHSFDFGKLVLATPLLTSACADSTSLANCTNKGYVDVSNTTNFQPSYTATTRSWEGANAKDSTLVTVNCTAWEGTGTSKICTAGTYDSHYLAGNYYTWNAATAGTGGSITSGEASGSICPKGWKLPTGYTSGELRTLTTAYGVSSSLSGTAGGVTYNIAGGPLRFIRGGTVNNAGKVSGAGQTGFYWSSTALSSGNAARLYFTNDGVTYTVNFRRYVGQFVRCVAQ